MSIASSIFSHAQSGWQSVILLLLVTYIAYFYYKYYTRENPLPGPIPLPLLGNFLQIGWDLPRWANKAQAKYGDAWEVWLGRERSIFLGRADFVEKIYNPSTKNNFTMRTGPSEGLDEFGYTNKGIIMNRESWQYNRGLVNQTVTAKSYLKELVKATQENFKETEGYWRKLASHKPLDFAAWSMCMVTDVTVIMSTGKPAYQCAIYYNSLVSDKAKIQHPQSVFKFEGDFVEAITTWFYAVQFSYFFPKWIRHYVPVFKSYQDKFMKNSKWMLSTLLEIIKERRQEIECAPPHVQLPANVLTLLLTTNTPRDMTKVSTINSIDRPMNDAEIAENLVEVFAAGIDTTANSLTFMIWNMCKYPHAKQRLLEEMAEVFGPNLQNREITQESLEKLIYFDAFIKETARLTPVVPALVKTAQKDDEIVGFRWKAGTQFYTNIHGIHLNPAHWDNPQEFDPDRFLKIESSKTKNALLQFGGGLRICPGRQMAILELKTLLVCLLRKYEIELEDSRGELQYSFGMINHCDNLNVFIRPKAF
ncbi:10799_t:CDS:2 [Ambispora gerdemannii]|uniref:10799_t:CDS:1 n=1 Tax=Ambispora gerdemannii TaxID=144530 RepID=A0A9N8ZBP0_9GLOM|nr:10799_t:CDS:2 [Ambispora gerdemannii]